MSIKKCIRVSMSLALIVLMLSGCNLFLKPNGVVEGMVTMGDGESPLPAVLVVDGKEHVTAGAEGKYSISLKPGQYKIYAKYSTSQSAEATVTVEPKATTTANFKVENLGILSGTVKSSDDKILAGAKVKLGTVETTINESGEYSMLVSSGAQKLVVEYKGYVYEEDYTMATAAVTKDIVLDDIKEITLALKNGEEQPLVGWGANIKVGSFGTSTTANAEGNITFIGVADEGQLTVSTAANLLMPEGLKVSNTAAVDFATATEATLDIDLFEFEDTFDDGLDKWTEEESWELNQWAKTEKGAKVSDGVLYRDFVAATSSGLMLNDYVAKDVAVVVRVKPTAERGDAVTGLRVHIRNTEEKWNYGFGANVSTYSYELANWHGAAAKTVIVGPAEATPQIFNDQWSTITVILQGSTLKYYLDGVLVAETTETDDTLIPVEGKIFLEFNGALHIDTVRVYDL